MQNLDSILNLLNFWPGLKTKLGAILAFGLAVIAAWNTMVPALGYGPCELTPEMLAAGMKSCGTDLTVQIPSIISAIVLALVGVGAANQPKNLAKTVTK